MALFGHGREELDDEEAHELVNLIRNHVELQLIRTTKL